MHFSLVHRRQELIVLEPAQYFQMLKCQLRIKKCYMLKMFQAETPPAIYFVVIYDFFFVILMVLKNSSNLRHFANLIGFSTSAAVTNCCKFLRIQYYRNNKHQQITLLRSSCIAYTSRYIFSYDQTHPLNTKRKQS